VHRPSASGDPFARRPWLGGAGAIARPLFWKIGLSITLIGIAPLIYALCWNEHHNWTPLTLPISLTPGEVRSPEFTTDLQGRYLVNLVLQPMPDLPKEQCRLGVNWWPYTCKEEAAVHLDWQVVDDGGSVIASGPYKPLSVSGSEVTFAVFQAKRGVHQRIVLRIDRDAGELNAAHPKIVVEAGPEYWEALADFSGFAVQWAEIVGTLGCVWLLIALLYRTFSRRRESRSVAPRS